MPYVDLNGLRTWHEARGDGEPVVYAKTLRMIETEPEIELASLTTVEAPTLILQGDRDEVTLEHGAAVATALPTDGWPCSRAPTSRRSRARRW